MSSEGTIDYEALTQEAMRGVVRRVLEEAGKDGLPGDHHFYISFDTLAPGVVLSKRLREKYAEEMTIVLQHRFWDLLVSEDRFEVKLTFDGIPERLVIPYRAIKVFFDPSVRYGLQFEATELSQPSGSHPMMVDREDRNGIGAPAPRGLEPDHPPPGERPPRSRPTSVPDGEDEGDVFQTSPRIVAATEAQAPTASDSDADAEEAKDEGAGNAGAEIVSLDAFRKK